MLQDASTLLKLAARNVLAQRVNLLVALPLCLSAALFVVLGSIWTDVTRVTERAIVGCFIGDLQIYSGQLEHAAMYQLDGPPVDAPVIPHQDELAQLLRDSGQVARTVPMGMAMGSVYVGNVLDRLLAEIRADVRTEKAGGAPSPARAENLARVQYIVHTLRQDLENRVGFFAPESYEEDLRRMRLADSPSFWADFERDPYPKLELLENHTAPLVTGANVDNPVSFVGSPLESLRAAFPNLQRVRGEWIPPGKTGLLLPDTAYDRLFKLPTAWRMDELHRARDERHERIAESPDLQAMVRANRDSIRELSLALGPVQAPRAQAAIAAFLHSPGTLEELLPKFFDTDDQSFDARFRFFYDVLAPMLDLYSVHLGEPISIRALTNAGGFSTTGVTVYGTYALKGVDLDSLSDIPMCLVDPSTFRSLLGVLSADDVREMSSLQGALHVSLLSADEAESELGKQATVDRAPTATVDPARLVHDGIERARAAPAALGWTPDLTRSISVLLAPGVKPQTFVAAMRERARAAGIDVKLVPWKAASGYLGSFVTGATALLLAGIGLVLLVLALLVHNTLLTVVLQRESELGALRAVGAQKRFLLWMVLAETGLLSIGAGGVGAALGAAGVEWLHRTGIPSGGMKALTFFFGGPSLRPDLSAGVVAGAILAIALASIVSAYLPARWAMRVTPLRAMQAQE